MQKKILVFLLATIFSSSFLVSAQLQETLFSPLRQRLALATAIGIASTTAAGFGLYGYVSG